MINAAQELIAHIQNQPMMCAHIWYSNLTTSYHTLQVGYSPAMLQAFLKSLDFEYNEDYRHQHLFGTIFMQDGTWLVRGESDGYEYWDWIIKPSIPKQCVGL